MSDGLGRQTGNGSWQDKKVRDNNGKNGVVVEDYNSPFERHLTIKFEDGVKYILVLNNDRRDKQDIHGIEWEFSPKEYPGQWACISDNPKMSETQVQGQLFSFFEQKRIEKQAWNPEVKYPINIVQRGLGLSEDEAVKYVNNFLTERFGG